MHVSDFLDYKTLLASECVLGIVFTIVFMGLNRIFPQIRGANPIALSFALAVPATIFLAMSGHVAPVISVLMADALTLSSLIAMYEGVLQFTGGPNRRWLLWLIAFSSFLVVYFNTEVHPNVAPCIISMSLVIAVIRGFSAQALFQKSVRSTQRKTLQLFGVFLCAMGFISLRLAWNTYRYGPPTGMTEVSAEQTMMRAAEMFYMAIAGLFCLVLISRELASRRRGDAHRDALTGAFSRDGLELNLAVEIDRSNRGGSTFSIALVEVDQLGRIMESEGRAGTNATLREATEAIGGCLRGTDYIGRFSRDQFLLVLSQTVQSEALIVVERIAGEVGKLKLLTGSEPLTLSVGITESATGDSAPQMISRAEQALFLATSAGRNCSRVVLAHRTGATGSTDSEMSALA